MAYGRKSTASSILEVFNLNPLPYPVLLILAVIFIFLGLSWSSSYEDTVESAQEQMGLALFVTPVLLLILAIWLPSMENPMNFFGLGYNRNHRQTYYSPSEGSSPWGVAAVIVLLLILVQYQSAFHDSWFG